MTAQEDEATIEHEGRRILAYARVNLDRAVPQYPTWTLRDLVLHVGSIHARTAAICETLPQEPIAAPERPPEADAVDWAAAQLERMLRGLRSTDPSVEVWTFVSDRRLAFWRRRMVIETGLHRWDAQGAAGQPKPLLPLVAAHGIDEFADLYLPRLGDVPPIQLRATDLARGWLLGADEPVAAVDGTASDLYLRLMSRPGVRLPAAWERAVDSLPSAAGV